jgi:hypothetical protein
MSEHLHSLLGWWSIRFHAPSAARSLSSAPLIGGCGTRQVLQRLRTDRTADLATRARRMQ